MSQKRLMASFNLSIGQKNAQILENDFGNLQNLETSHCLSNFKFSVAFVKKFNSKSN